MQDAIKIIAKRYSESQIMKAQDIVGDLMDEVGLDNIEERNACELVFGLLSAASNVEI